VATRNRTAPTDATTEASVGTPVDPATLIELEHEGIDATFSCTPRAFAHWKARGWEPVDKQAAAAAVDAVDTADKER
jgi:hypothetical protein